MDPDDFHFYLTGDRVTGIGLLKSAIQRFPGCVIRRSSACTHVHIEVTYSMSEPYLLKVGIRSRRGCDKRLSFTGPGNCTREPWFKAQYAIH